jgi:hypothetical protein
MMFRIVPRQLVPFFYLSNLCHVTDNNTPLTLLVLEFLVGVIHLTHVRRRLSNQYCPSQDYHRTDRKVRRRQS